MRVRLVLAALLVSAMAVAAGCGSSSSSGNGGSGSNGSSGPSLPQSIGPLEGSLNLIAWQGYTEDNVVKPFEKQTGCQVNVKYGQTSDEMYKLMQSGNYDGVSASGDASNRLIASGLVSPINTSLISDFGDISPQLQSPPHNTIDGVHYGVSYQWGANVLMYNKTVVSPAPDSWGVIFDGTSYKGKVDAYDSPIYIADAALYLKSAQPDLKITDPYELTQPQFDAAVNLLKKQHQQIGNYWSSYTAQIQDFTQGSIVIGPTWPYQLNTLKAAKVPVEAVAAQGGRDRLGGHLDGVLEGGPSQLHAEVDGLRDHARGAGQDRLHVRLGSGQPEGLHDPGQAGQELLRRLPRHGSELLRSHLLLEDTADRLRRQQRQHLRRLHAVVPGVD